MQTYQIILLIILGVLAVIGIVSTYVFLIFPSTKAPKNKLYDLLGSKYAHRGIHTKDQKVPENSALSFNLAKMFNYGIELDLNLTKDEQVVVFHDNDLKRVCNVPGKVKDFTYDELRHLSLFNTNERIPRFEDILKIINGDIPMIIEFKNTPNYVKLCENAIKLLDNYKGDFCIESFNPYIVRWFFKNRPNIIRGQLAAGMKTLEGQNVFVRFIISNLIINVLGRPHFVAYEHNDFKSKISPKLFKMFGGKLIAWTVNDSDIKKKNIDKFDTIIFEYFKP